MEPTPPSLPLGKKNTPLLSASGAASCQKAGPTVPLLSPPSLRTLPFLLFKLLPKPHCQAALPPPTVRFFKK